MASNPVACDVVPLARRRPGISVLIPTQNEQFVVEPCIRSFLELGDELVVVDNGSSDHTKDIVSSLARAFPRQMRFFDRPELSDLHHNRAFAYAQSRYRWVVRADSDYVCYTEGPNRIQLVREHILGRRSLRPEVIWVPQVNLVGDFFHTGIPYARPGGYRGNPERQYVPEATSAPMPRFYRTFPGFGFVRRGRREQARLARLARRNDWPGPVWVHCTIKSDRNYLYRSERTNWRELGDYTRFPSLETYVRHAIQTKYGTSDIDVAAQRYVAEHVLPYLTHHDEETWPLPRLLVEHRAKHPCFSVGGHGDHHTRRALDFEPEV